MPPINIKLLILDNFWANLKDYFSHGANCDHVFYCSKIIAQVLFVKISLIKSLQLCLFNVNNEQYHELLVLYKSLQLLYREPVEKSIYCRYLKLFPGFISILELSEEVVC